MDVAGVPRSQEGVSGIDALSAASRFAGSQDQEKPVLWAEVAMQADPPCASHGPEAPTRINSCHGSGLHRESLEPSNGRVTVGTPGALEQ